YPRSSDGDRARLGLGGFFFFLLLLDFACISAPCMKDSSSDACLLFSFRSPFFPLYSVRILSFPLHNENRNG
ncbi:hypothetical protein JOL62DRAFT_568609, partial [Phyllosticta paracitricarpa]